MDHPNAKTVYAVSSGEYADYGVAALYATRERAEYVAFLRNSASHGFGAEYFVEPFEIDPDETEDGIPAATPALIEVWKVALVVTIAGIKPVSAHRRATIMIPVATARIVFGFRVPIGTHVNDYWDLYVTQDEAHDDWQRAVRIATDRLSAHIARQAGLT